MRMLVTTTQKADEVDVQPFFVQTNKVDECVVVGGMAHLVKWRKLLESETHQEGKTSTRADVAGELSLWEDEEG
jgi:hypothetical protein